MKRLFVAAATVLALSSLNACASPSRAGEADDLRSALAEMPGVSTVKLDYTEPVILDSGKLELRVTMLSDAEPEDLVRVTKRAYVGFEGPHHGEEGDLFVTWGDDTVHVRSFEPQARVAAVEQAAQHAMAVLPASSVRVDLATQDVARSPHVFTEYAVTIGEKGGDGVLQTLSDLEEAHAGIPDAAWGVQTRADETGWQLASASGFPDTQQRALFDRLRQGIPRGASILLDDEFATAQVPPSVTPDEVSAMVGRHVGQLGGMKKAFYDVTSGEDFHLMNSAGDCTFATDPIGARLKKDHGAACSKVTVVES